MKKSLCYVLITLMTLFTFACKKEISRPYGAEDIDYDKVEGINKNGPIPEMSHPENTPPMSNKTVVEKGPERIINNDVISPPMADMDEQPNYGDVPIFVPAHKD